MRKGTHIVATRDSPSGYYKKGDRGIILKDINADPDTYGKGLEDKLYLIAWLHPTPELKAAYPHSPDTYWVWPSEIEEDRESQDSQGL